MDIYSSNLSINQKIQEINDKKWLPKSVTTYGSLDSVKNDILIYYEYSQFKNKHTLILPEKLNTIKIQVELQKCILIV